MKGPRLLNLLPYRGANRLWASTTTLLLVGVGVVLSVVSFAVVMNLPDMAWHSARDAEVRATYSTFEETGVPLIKHIDTGSYYTQQPGPGDLTFAAWDDDPGSYLIASLMSAVTGSDSPFPGLKLVMAILVALPMLWLPLAIARLFKRPAAGYSLIALPVVMWLLNDTLLAGTEYGLSDAISTLPVYALYGIAASMVFLSLSLVVWATTYRFGFPILIAISLGLAALAGFGNLARSLSGIGVAIAVGVLWWLNSGGRLRVLKALLAAAVAVLVAIGVQNGVMAAINIERSEATGISLGELPDGHGTWHPLYLGLAYPQPITGQPSPFAVEWNDAWGWEQARKVDPDVLIGGEEYDLIVKDLYLDAVLSDPLTAGKLYVKKALYVLQHFGGLVVFIVSGFLLVLTRRVRQRRRLVVALTATLPTLALGLIPPVMVMPMLYYYSELSAVLGILTAIALGAITWAILPSRHEDQLEVATVSEATPESSPPDDEAETAAGSSDEDPADAAAPAESAGRAGAPR